MKGDSIMLSKRIIPCLDLKNGRVVKGVNFVNLVDAGDPIAIAKAYSEQGADELVFLDITASSEERQVMLEVIEQAAREVFIPLTVGGGIRTTGDIRAILNAGADKISMNTPAVERPEFITEAAKQFGSQCIVVAIDAKKVGDTYEVYTHGGRKSTGKEAVSWAKEVAQRGAGEILLTCMDTDGRQTGYAVELTRQMSEAVNIPIIASGGAGCKEHFLEIFEDGKADAALAASLFHFKTLEIKPLKNYLSSHGITMRI